MMGRLLTAVFLLFLGGVTTWAQDRHALVIGIDAYFNVPSLGRAVSDARSMHVSLQSLGFKSRLVENADRTAMSVALAGFEESVEKGDTAFVFFAGHGIEIAGQNVLLPSDAPDPGRATAGVLRDAGFNTAALVERITARGARSAFFVFDACRDNPYAKSGNTRSVGATRGLARTEAPEGVFVLLSAGQNQQALDSLNQPGMANTDASPNSVFTRVLLDEMSKPGLTHIVLAKAVQTRVRDLARSVGHLQVPAFYDQIIGDVVLRRGDAATLPQVAVAPVVAMPVQPAPSLPPALLNAGMRWDVQETSSSGIVFDGVWTQTKPGVFNAQWRARGSSVTTSDTIELESHRGDAIVLYRRGINGRYFGTLSAGGQIVWGHASWYAAGDRWAAEIRSAGNLASARQVDISTPPDPVLARGARWIVRERSANGDIYEGVWTRKTSQSFTAQWRLLPSGVSFTDTIEIEQQYGNVVVLHRKGINGRYFGTLSRDGSYLQGHASWYAAGDSWSAEIK